MGKYGKKTEKIQENTEKWEKIGNMWENRGKKGKWDK